MSAGAATSSVRGIITCPAFRSAKPNTRWSICSSCSSSTPASWLAVTSIFSSASECTIEWPPSELKPSMLTTARPMPLRTRMNGQNAFMNSSVGFTTSSEVPSGLSSAIVFGASSPRTMCSAVTMAKAMATAMLCAVASAIVSGRKRSPGAIIAASAGSPIQPRPMLDMVMPSWVAAMNGSGSDTARRTARAARCPSAISWSTRVLRTVTIENSAATKKPLARTSASTAASRHSASPIESSMAGILRFSVAEEVRVDEVVDDRLVDVVDLLELDAHADAAVAPGDLALGVDVLLRSRHPEADLDLGAALERAGGADGDAAVTEVERQRRRDRVAEPVLNRDAEDDARAAAAVEVVGEQVRRQRRQDVLHGAVLVDVAGDAERGQLAHFVGARDRAAEDQHRQAPFVELADRANQVDARRVRQPQVDDDEINLCKIGADARQQLGRALDHDRLVPGALDRRAKAVAHERRVVGDHNGLRRDRGCAHLRICADRAAGRLRCVAVSSMCRYNSNPVAIAPAERNSGTSRPQLPIRNDMCAR